MADEPSLGEVARRLERLESRIEEGFRDLSVRVVSNDLYTRDRAETDRRLAEIERDLDAERIARREAVKEMRDAIKEVRDQVDKQAERQSGNWRQALYGGVVPGLIVLVSVAVQLVIATRGGK